MVIRIFSRNVEISAVLYVCAIIAAMWPGVSEGLGARVVLWNCLPATLGFVAVIMTSGRSRRHRMRAMVFAATTAVVAIFFLVAWLSTGPLDPESYPLTTFIVFVFAPLISLGLGTVGYIIARFATVAVKMD
jgi:predicted anti-sigma-YlaC factor YlaD